MNRKSVSDGSPPFDLSLKSEEKNFMKLHSVGNECFQKHSPIKKNAATETKRKSKSVARQKRNPWSKEVSSDKELKYAVVVTSKHKKSILSNIIYNENIYCNVPCS